jgi:hypothetical protein
MTRSAIVVASVLLLGACTHDWASLEEIQQTEMDAASSMPDAGLRLGGALVDGACGDACTGGRTCKNGACHK